MTTARHVLVTGATGLIGRAVTAALVAQGTRVTALSRSGRAVAGVDGTTCDLLDPNSIAAAVTAARPSDLLHLAWADGADRWSGLANLDWLVATVTLLRTFAASGGRRAVMVGSCAEYDWSAGVLGEATALRPATLYGAAKAAASLACLGAAPQLGVSLAWARPFFVYGPDEPTGRLLGDLIAGLRAGVRVPCTDGRQRRDYLHVDDLAAGLLAVLESDLKGAVNIASGHAIAVRDLIGEVARQLGRPDLVDLGARPRPPGDPDVIQADISRLVAEAGFRPRHTLATGVAALLSAQARP